MAYDELYTLIDPHNDQSDTYVAKIIKATFTNNEQTALHMLWIQAILEIIFDPEYLSPKLDTDIVDQRFALLQKQQEAYIILYSGHFKK